MWIVCLYKLGWYTSETSSMQIWSSWSFYKVILLIPAISFPVEDIFKAQPPLLPRYFLKDIHPLANQTWAKLEITMMHCRSLGFRPDSFSPRITSFRASGGESLGPHFLLVGFWPSATTSRHVEDPGRYVEDSVPSVLSNWLKSNKTRKVHTQLIVGKVSS